MSRAWTQKGREAYVTFCLEGYIAYLKTTWWESLRHSLMTGKCRACETTPARCLHHTSYKYLGREKVAQLTPLCLQCHSRLHDRLSTDYPGLTRGKAARHSANVWTSLFGRPMPSGRQAKRASRIKEQLRENWAQNRISKPPRPLSKRERRIQRLVQSAKQVKLPEPSLSIIPLASLPAQLQPNKRPCGVLTTRLRANTAI
ncbi:hypothetical protein LCGC14_0839530 [marine sediment metagenome]|uniref:Uncharacterized protein n=1 Tax=marine sediment metagenome TaxID=412755 RepID=A0A0F9PDK1_9ZZZZ